MGVEPSIVRFRVNDSTDCATSPGVEPGKSTKRVDLLPIFEENQAASSSRVLEFDLLGSRASELTFHLRIKTLTAQKNFEKIAACGFV